MTTVLAAAWNAHLSKGDCMKSQASAILHVLRGVLKDIQATYPELEVGLSKDLDRLTLYCQTRGLGFFTLDLPALHSNLLLALESGRLVLEGPLSRAVSSRVRVPRLFSGLWLRVFDRDSCLKREVDTNALFFLRQVLSLGSKIVVDCSTERVSAKLEEYFDVESKLRPPSLDWDGDELWPASVVGGCGGEPPQPLLFGHLGRYYASSSVYNHLDGIQLSFDYERSQEAKGQVSTCPNLSDSLHLAEALKFTHKDFWESDRLPLFERESERDPLVYRQDVEILTKVQRVADLLFDTIGEFDPIVYSNSREESNRGIGFRHGPGAVAERLKNEEKSKFLNWSAKLGTTYPWETCGKTAGSTLDVPANHEPASIVYQVPKTAKGPRLIAAEPTSHQWCQQAVLGFLFDRCSKIFRSSFIDFKDQTKSGRMVLDASRNRDLATVDLSDASDRLSCWTIERMLRKNPSLLRAIHSARTRYTRVDNLGYSSFLKLRKFASQGTAVTFPVMSLVMLCIAIGSCLDDTDVTWDKIWKFRSRIRVFGDDIILPSHGYAQLCRAMDLLQLKVNSSKSYVTGRFRESCGVDGFDGFDITPTRPKTFVADSPDSCRAVLDLTNNLFNKGLWHASEFARFLLPYEVRKHLPVVGPHETGRTGFPSYVGGDENHLRQRWNRSLHRHEVRVWSTKLHTRKTVRSGYDALLDFFTRIPGPSNPRIVSEYVCRRKTRSCLLWEPKGTDPIEDPNSSRRAASDWGKPLF